MKLLIFRDEEVMVWQGVHKGSRYQEKKTVELKMKITVMTADETITIVLQYILSILFFTPTSILCIYFPLDWEYILPSFLGDITY